MERQKDECNLTRALQALLNQDEDTIIILQEAKHHANMMSANGKTMTELMAQLNDFLFRDIVPALKNVRPAGTDRTEPIQQQADPLDRYLAQGDDGTVMPQAFVDDMSGWAAPLEAAGQKKKENQTIKHTDINLYRSVRSGKKVSDAVSENHEDENHETDRYQGRRGASSLKQTAIQAPDYSAMATRRVQRAAVLNATGSQGKPAGSRPSGYSSTAAGIARTPSSISASSMTTTTANNDKVKKALGTLPTSSHVSSRSRSVSKSTSRLELQGLADSAKKKDRIGKNAAAGLVADQVLDVRSFGTAKEYLIQWQGLSTPLWIARRKATSPVRELIDVYAAELRRQNSTPDIPKRGREASRRGRKRRHNAGVQHAVTRGSSEAAGAKFYIVDHIVYHRTHYNKRQYLVRWENYSESHDTWENAEKLRADVPNIVDAYEKKIQRDDAQSDAVQPATLRVMHCSSSVGKSVR